MKILAVSDEECTALWDYYRPGVLDKYDLILACGDLKPAYLTFLVTMSRARLLYIHGNHDEIYLSKPPEGCEDIDGHYVEYNGVKILGLGGCLWYHPGNFQYTEKQMERRIKGLSRAIKKYGNPDIIITHAPPLGIGDLPDNAHKGFECFVDLIDKCQPKLFLHGHTHLRYGIKLPREHARGETRVINVSERFELEIPDAPDRHQEDKFIRRTRYKDTRPLW